MEHLSSNYDVQVCAITRSLGDFSNEEIKYFLKSDVERVELDLSDLSSVKSFVESRDKMFSDVSILINNAGQRYRKELDEIDDNELEELFRVNVITPFVLAKACLHGMKQRRHGKIVNISSILGKSGLTFQAIPQPKVR